MKIIDRSQLAVEWIENADEDLEFAKVGFDETEFYAKICFHCQQAAEKYLKAYLISKNVDPRPIHDLIRLLKQITKIDKSFDELAKSLVFLNQFAIEARYPQEWPPSISKEDSRIAIGYVQQIGLFVKEKLKE